MDGPMQSTLRRTFSSPMGAPRTLRREKRSIYKWAQNEKFVFDEKFYELPSRPSTFSASDASIGGALKNDEESNKTADPKQALRRANTVPTHSGCISGRKPAPPILQLTKSLEQLIPTSQPSQTHDDAGTADGIFGIFGIETELTEAFTDPRSPANYRSDFEDREELTNLRRPSIHTPPQTNYDPIPSKIEETMTAVHDMPSPPATPKPAEEEDLMVFGDEPKVQDLIVFDGAEAPVERVMTQEEVQVPEKRHEREMPSPPATPKPVKAGEVEDETELQKEIEQEPGEIQIPEEPVFAETVSEVEEVEVEEVQEQEVQDLQVVGETIVLGVVQQQDQTVEEPVVVEAPVSEVEQTFKSKPKQNVTEEPSPESIIDLISSTPVTPPLPPDFSFSRTLTKKRSMEIPEVCRVERSPPPPPAPLPEDIIPDTPRIRKGVPTLKAVSAAIKLANIVVTAPEIIEDPVPAVETFFGEPKSCFPTTLMDAPRSTGLGIEFAEALEEMANQQVVDPDLVEDVPVTADAIVKRPRMTPALAQRRAHHCLLQGHMFIHHRGPGNGQRPFNPWISCARCGKKKLRQAWQCALIDKCGIVVCGRCREDMNLQFVVEEEEIREERVWVETFYEGNRVWGRWEREEVVERHLRWGKHEVFTDQKEVYMKDPQHQSREIPRRRKVRGGGWKL